MFWSFCYVVLRRVLQLVALRFRSNAFKEVEIVVSGYPDITVPAGHDGGLPIGITFIGGRWTEPKLLGLAYDYEQATHVRVPPQFIPTIGDALFPGVPNPPDQMRAQRQQATRGQRDLVVRLR